MAEADDRTHDRRVGQMLADSDPELEDELDPDLVARLAAWFAPTPHKTDSREEEEIRLANEARANAASRVDPAFHAHLEGKGEYHAAMVRPLPPVGLSVDPGIARFDYAVWGLTTTAEIQETERPEDIRDILRENTPQAVLRDLYRPVQEPPNPVFYEQTSLISLPGHIHELVVRVMATCYTADMTGSLSPSYCLRTDRAALRATLDAPWENSKPEKPAELGASVPDEANLFWFGQSSS